MNRNDIALALQQQQQRRVMPGQPLGSPFAPPPALRPTPVAGTPNLPIAAPTPQYGFQTGYNAAMGAPVGRPGAAPVGALPEADKGGSDWAKKLQEMLFGASGSTA